MLKINFVFLIFLIASCVSPVNSLLSKGSFSELLTTYKVDLLSIENFNNNKEISRPSGTWLPLITFYYLGDFEKGKLKKCLIYKIPYKKSEGVLKLVPLNKNETCKGKILTESKETLTNIKNIKVSLYSRRETIRKKRASEFYSFRVSYSKKGSKENSFDIPLYNLTDPKIRRFDNQGRKVNKFFKKVFIKFDSSSTQNKLGGVILLPKGKRDFSGKEKSVFIGRLNDSFPERTSIKCHKVDDHCRIVEEYKCDKCKYGWYEVIGSKCRTIRDKYCGINRCGKKGWPACIRGFNFSKSAVQSGCYAESKSGFCEKGLVTACDGDKNLICL